MNVVDLYKIFAKHPVISTDSRRVVADSLFFALKGENFNGNLYAQKALACGAAFAVVDEAQYCVSQRYILVDDVLTALQQLATYHRQQLNVPILAITGTNGKTTTKELVTAVLSKKFKVEYTRGNLNNHIGVPLTLLSMNTETQMGVVEMGANHPGEIAALCHIALPDYGLITNVGKAHLEGFGSFEGVKKTKAELYRFIQSVKGKIFIHSSNPHLAEMADGVDGIRYKTAKMGEGIEGELVQSAPNMVFQVKFPKGWLYIKTHLAGGYNLENALAAVCVGNYFGVQPLEIVDALEHYEPTNNRSQFIQTSSNKILMDAYNANPMSMEAALENFSRFEAPLKGVILGDMLELGETSHEEHQRVVDQLATIPLSLVLLMGHEFSMCILPPHMMAFADKVAVIHHLEEHPVDQYLILIKGSRGMKLESLLEKL